MLAVRKRGKNYHADYLGGGVRIRASLGTRNQEAARRIAHRLETALAEGAESPIWPGLKATLPEKTYREFADYAGVKEQRLPSWTDLLQSFDTYLKQRIDLGKFRSSTADRYWVTLREFEVFLSEKKITLLQDFTKPVVEAFKVWRTARIKKKKFSRKATSLVLDAAILHRIFSFAVENEMILKNPVKMEGRPGDNPEGGAEPFAPEEILRLREAAGEDMLSFSLLRWTGFRGIDAVSITWHEIHFDRREIERITQKRRKKVILPIPTELLFLLEAERDRRNPKPTDRVLLNPSTGKPMSRPRLYERMKALGKQAGVDNVHPHRFRDTLAVNMLEQGAGPYDVAKMLGDTIATTEKHYTPFVPVLRERVRGFLESASEVRDRAKISVTNQSKNALKVM